MAEVKKEITTNSLWVVLPSDTPPFDRPYAREAVQPERLRLDYATVTQGESWQLTSGRLYGKVIRKDGSLGQGRDDGLYVHLDGQSSKEWPDWAKALAEELAPRPGSGPVRQSRS